MLGKVLLFVLLISSPLSAGIDLKGEIENYSNKEVFIYTFLNNSEILLDKVQTDAKGHFDYNNKQDYQGIIKLMLADTRNSGIVFSSGQPIEFSAKNSGRELKFTEMKDPANKMYLDYKNADFQQKNSLISQLEALYSPQDPFYKQLKQEQNNINNQYGIDLSKYPFIEYYIDLENNYLLAEPEDQEEADVIAAGILQHLVNDGEDLEKTYLMTQLINTYLTYQISKYSTSVEQIEGLKNSINYLLEESVIETSRGQNILVSVINILKSYSLDYIADEYVEIANGLTCTKTQGLLNTIESSEITKLGATFPNIEFTHTIKDKKSLYDIKSKYKMIIFWGSFCSHCQAEKPLLQAYYPEFKEKGGEIYSFAIESEKSEYEKFVYGLPWYSDTDLLYWSSPIVEKYGIDGTPTFFLLDDNNVIIAKGAKLELIREEIE